MSELKPSRYRAKTINGDTKEGYPIPIGPSKWREGHKPEPEWFIQSAAGYVSGSPIDITTLEILDIRSQDGLKPTEESDIIELKRQRGILEAVFVKVQVPPQNECIERRICKYCRYWDEVGNCGKHDSETVGQDYCSYFVEDQIRPEQEMFEF